MKSTTAITYRLIAFLAGGCLLPGQLCAQPRDNAIRVTATPVLEQRIAPLVPAPGTVHSRNRAQLTAGLEGRLEWIAEPGMAIESGQPVARFDCADLSLRREELVALADLQTIRFRSLQAEVARLEKATLATSVTQLERTRADRDQAGGEVRIAEVRIQQTDNVLKRCQVLAPFSGVVTEQMRGNGEDVARGDLLASMTDIRNLEVRAAVPIRYLPRVVKGSQGAVRLNDLTFPGQVRTAVPAANAGSQTFEVRIDLPSQASSVLAAGQLVSVSLPLTSEPHLTVPRDAVVLRSTGSFVMQIDAANVARAIPVEVAESRDDRVAVRGALRVGDIVALRGAEAIEDGDRVQVQSDS